MFVTVFREVKRPIVGMTIVANDPTYESLERNLDWLETTGVLVERFDPAVARAEVENRSTVKAALAEHGKDALPLILVDGVIVSRSTCPTRAQLARMVGRGHRRVRHAIVRQIAAIGAAAATGDEDSLRAETGRAHELGLSDEVVRLAREVGARGPHPLASGRIAS